MHYEKCSTYAENFRFNHNSREYTFEYDSAGKLIAIHSSNEDLNPAMTKYNRNLTPDDGRSQSKRFHDRLGELSYRRQRNNIRLCEICIHAPKNVPKEEMGKFFKTARTTLQKLTGGSKNEVSAYVHFDERSKSPHMHYLFVPGIEVDGIEKLSAKRLMNRSKINQLHPVMQREIDKAFGHHKYLVVADDPADRAQSSDTLKAYKAKQQKLDELGRSISSATEDLQIIRDSVNLAKRQVQQAKAELENINHERLAAEKEFLELQAKKQAMHDKLSGAAELCKEFKDYFSFDSYLSDVVEQQLGGLSPSVKMERDIYINWQDSAEGQTYHDLEVFEHDFNAYADDLGL